MPLVIIVDPLDRLTQPAKGIEVQPYTAMFRAKLACERVDQLVRKRFETELSPIEGVADVLTALDHPRYDVWMLRCDVPEDVPAVQDGAAGDAPDAATSDGVGE